MFFSELGDGWAPAVLDTRDEHDFINQSQKGWSDDQNYFIGGSVCPEHTGSFDYYSRDINNMDKPAYLTSHTGNFLSRSPFYILNECKQIKTA